LAALPDPVLAAAALVSDFVSDLPSLFFAPFLESVDLESVR
jgi:hypothetical protein